MHDTESSAPALVKRKRATCDTHGEPCHREVTRKSCGKGRYDPDMPPYCKVRKRSTQLQGMLHCTSTSHHPPSPAMLHDFSAITLAHLRICVSCVNAEFDILCLIDSLRKTGPVGRGCRKQARRNYTCIYASHCGFDNNDMESACPSPIASERHNSLARETLPTRAVSQS